RQPLGVLHRQAGGQLRRELRRQPQAARLRARLEPPVEPGRAALCAADPMRGESMETPYTIHNDIKFKALELIDIARLQRATKEQWFNQTLCEVNDSVVRLGVLQG